jgi:hypothetical protein
MTGTTITGAHLTGVILDPSTQNPVTVSATGTVADTSIALLGEVVATAWTVSNLGTIDGTGMFSIGIDLESGGEITNGSNAATNALIKSEGFFAVFIPGGTGKVANLGTIEGAGTSSGGVDLFVGGSVANGSKSKTAALISAVDGRAISIGGTAGGSGTVTNFGTVETSGKVPVPLAPAIYLGGGGTIANYGLIKGAVPSTGGPQGVITTHNALAAIRNFGTILSTNGNNAVNLDHGGTIINGSAGDKVALISGLSSGIVGGNNPHTGGAYGVGAAATIVNYGTIKSTGSAPVISLISGGAVTNHGTIQGTGTGNPGSTGVFLAGGAAKVTNSGKIASAGENGFGVDLHSNGYVRNTGLISAYHIGIYANTTTSTGTVVNLGTIKSTQKATSITFNGDGILLGKGGDVRNGSTVDLTASISAVDGVAVSMHGNGTLTNFGTLTSANAARPTVNLIAGGQVGNGAAKSVTALIGGRDIAVNITGAAGTVTNFGTIATTGTINPAIYLGAGGRVTNFGKITGATGIAGAIDGTAAINLTNAGKIVGTRGTAVAFGGGNDVLNVEKGAVFAGKVEGGGGADKIAQGVAGTLDVAGFSGFETIVLFVGGPDTLTLKNANFAGITGSAITVTDSGKGSTVSAAGVAAADHIIVHAGIGADRLTGGAGNDVFYAGGKTTMTGGGGANEFVFKTAGSNMIKDFHVSAKNELVFSNAGFNLGRTGGAATPIKLTPAQAAKLFDAKIAPTQLFFVS